MAQVDSCGPVRPTDSAPSNAGDQDVRLMRRAIALAAAVRTKTSPNPWVGTVVVPGPTSLAEVAPDGAVDPEIVLRRSHVSARRSARRGSCAECGGRPGEGIDLVHDTRAMPASRPHPSVHRRHRRGGSEQGGGRAVGPGSCRGRSRSRGPAACRDRGHGRRRGCGGGGAARCVPDAPANRSPARGVEAGSHDGRTHRRP